MSSIVNANMSTPESTQMYFCEAILSRDYEKAASVIYPLHLESLKLNLVELFKIEESEDDEEWIFEFFGEDTNLEQVRGYDSTEFFAPVAEYLWDKRDNSYNACGDIIGTVLETDSFAHIVVRDKSNSDSKAEAVSLRKFQSEWRMEMPRIIKQTSELFLLMAKEKH